MNGGPWSVDELTYLRAHYETVSAPDLSRRLGRTVSAIRRKANLIGLLKPPYQDRLTSRYAVDADAFDVLTPATAYVLGFIVADGSLSGDRLKLTNNDLDLLQKVRMALGSGHPLRVADSMRDRSYSICIRNKRLTNDLRALGITENKSLSGGWPQLPEGLLGHAIRGYFDGDGYSGYSPKAGLRVKFTSGSRTLLEELSTSIADHLGSTARHIEADRGRPHALRLWYYGPQAAQLGEWMYDGAGDLYIPRKRIPFEEYGNR